MCDDRIAVLRFVYSQDSMIMEKIYLDKINDESRMFLLVMVRLKKGQAFHSRTVQCVHQFYFSELYVP